MKKNKSLSALPHAIVKQSSNTTVIPTTSLPGAGKNTIAAALASPYCPLYDGTTSFRAFVDKFNMFCNALGLVVPERLAILPMVLKDQDAYDIYSDLPKHMRKFGGWELILDHLTSKICPVYTRPPAKSKLDNIVQDDLSVTAFAHALRQLSYAAYEHGDSAKDSALRDIFIRGLKPSLQTQVFQEQPRTLQHAIELARGEEAICSQTSDPQEMLFNAVQRALRPFTSRRGRNNYPKYNNDRFQQQDQNGSRQPRQNPWQALNTSRQSSNQEPSSYEELCQIVTDTTQPIPRSIMKQYYPAIISYIPVVIPLIRHVDFSIDRSNFPLIYITIDDKLVLSLWDSGSSVSYIRESTLAHLGITQYHRSKMTAATANGSIFKFLGHITLIIKIASYAVKHDFLISQDEHCPSPALLGLDFMKTLDKHNIHTHLRSARNTLIIGAYFSPFIDRSNLTRYFSKIKSAVNLINLETAVIPPNGTLNLRLQVEKPIKDNEWLCVQAIPDQSVRCLTTAFQPSPTLRVAFVNTSSDPVFIPAMERIGSASIVKLPGWNHRAKIDTYVPSEADWEAQLPSFPQDFMNDLDLSKADLTQRQKQHLKHVIRTNKVAFLNEDRNIGLFTGPVQHSIPLRTDMDMPKSRFYKIPLGKQEEVERQIEEMLKQGIIEPSTALFNSPVVLVKKKDDTFRLVTDFRALNSVTRKQTYVIPTISNIVDLAAGARYFSSFDLVSGFFQIPLKKSDRHLTAFTTSSGTYQYRRMPMGLCGAPHTFQTAVRYLQSRCQCRLFVYLGNLLVISNDADQHIADIQNVLENVAQLGLKIELKKCAFARSEVKFLGLIVGRTGLKPDPAKVQAISDYPIPRTPTAVRAFLGMAGFFRKFIEKFAHIATPLYDLTKADHDFVWGDAEQRAFETLKYHLTTAPVLSPPKANQPFVIESDGSNIAIGAVLLQAEDPSKPLQNLHPIAFASRKLIKAERNYAPIEIEALGLIFALNQFRIYILGTHTTCITDHRPLTSLLTRRDLFGRLAKFQLVIQEFDIEIRYREGRLNDVCDALSRYIGNKANDPKPVRKSMKNVLPKINFVTLSTVKKIQYHIANFVRTCSECQLRKKDRRHMKAELNPISNNSTGSSLDAKQRKIEQKMLSVQNTLCCPKLILSGTPIIPQIPCSQCEEFAQLAYEISLRNLWSGLTLRIFSA